MMEAKNNSGMRDWVVFIKVAEVGNLSKAAQELNISISAVSKSLSRLENYINVTLLRRDSRHLELTDAGQKAYVKIKYITSSFQSLLDELRNPNNVVSGSMRFSAPAIVCEFLANEWIWEFTNTYPNTKIYLDSRERSDFFSNSPEFDDLVLKSGKIENEDLIYRKLSPLKLVLCASPSYLKKHKKISHPSDLENHSILGIHNHGLSGPLTLYRNDESYTINTSFDTCISSNNLLSIINLVLHGKGINLMTPVWLVAGYLKNNELEIILPEWKVPDLPIYLVWRHRQYYSPLFQQFRSFIEDKWNKRPQVELQGNI
ncbi:TPA: LysR family transcriptional regulator [Escherichia coli]|uniref:LysR family transcriptional regulator n=1 Tax=Escherichia TaxID=561 RepID=UPI000390BE79|nr:MULTISPECIES: LysR family transcriptional regulator [Escherichia]EBN2212545.1 LysR family transcriptional regulator [Salmonella enterica]EEZ9682319.1 LysR family transcriptional regulator [Escherichia coli O55]EET8772100.1 LysR family transcriptional regulator [Escherichia coli]EEW0697014.1 LysR family transcriptional regulator [Escherichia coli]EEY4016477.1 LysR family transcriptional regulator [Escherichia coli]